MFQWKKNLFGKIKIHFFSLFTFAKKCSDEKKRMVNMRTEMKRIKIDQLITGAGQNFHIITWSGPRPCYNDIEIIIIVIMNRMKIKMWHLQWRAGSNFQKGGQSFFYRSLLHSLRLSCPQKAMRIFAPSENSHAPPIAHIPVAYNLKNWLHRFKSGPSWR